MKIEISTSQLTSFVGDVRPIWLRSDEDLKFAKIVWSVKGDSVLLKSCAGCFHGAFRYGAFITFIKEGVSTVSATLDGISYTCEVTVRARRDFSGEPMKFWHGDLHTHTTPEHEHDKYLKRTEYLIGDYLDYIAADGAGRDLAVMTDHSETIDLENFFRGFSEYEDRADAMAPIVYAGCENEIMYTEEDRFGREHRLSGELVAINATSFCQANTYPEFFYAFKNNPFAIGVFAHPHVVGISTRGIWDYRPRLNHPKELTSLIKYVEVLNSPEGYENLIHEYVYSEALDAGYRVSTSCGSDQHTDWNFRKFDAATIIMAPEKTREAFTDALLGLRAYACESGNVKLSYKVNGIAAPCDLPLADKYHFDVKIDYFRDDPATRPIRCEVISDGGKTLRVIEDVCFESFSFDIESSDARWFYLRFVDSKTYRTLSPPVFTGRAASEYRIDDLTPIDSAKFKAVDGLGRNASVLVDGDTMTTYVADGSEFTVTVDMGEKKCIKALGNYAALVDVMELRAKGLKSDYAEASLPVDYRISTSLDGENFTTAREGLFRAFAGEEIVRFNPTDARYVRLEVLSTAGKRSGRAAFVNAPAKMALVTIFE